MKISLRTLDKNSKKIAILLVKPHQTLKKMLKLYILQVFPINWAQYSTSLLNNPYQTKNTNLKIISIHF